jgi:hypothetical protein
MIIPMRHINFIEKKSKSIIENKRFELDYFVMILAAGSVLAVLLAVHMIQSRHLSTYEQELALIRQSTESKPEEIVIKPVTGVAWSQWLQKYSAQTAKLVRLNKISGTVQEGKKIVLEATAQTILDAGRLKRKLIKAGLCQGAELKKVVQSEDGILFELECKLL